MADELIRCAVVTISDRSSAGIRPDLSGPALVDYLQKTGWPVIETRLIPDDLETIITTLRELGNSGKVDLILTSGGTGFSPRDVTPEATLSVVEKIVPGLPEVMRAESRKINPHAILSRGCAGILGRTLILNLPGSPKAAIENLEVVVPTLPHAILTLRESPGAEPGHLSLNKE
jgi:molybdenum cofactor synthesis domain-containing protein